MLAEPIADTHAAALIPGVHMTVTFVSEGKRFAFASRHDTGESVYIAPMLAELAGLDRRSAGRVLVATIAPNTGDDFAGAVTSPWKAMSWDTHAEPAQGGTADLRTDLEDAMRHLEQVRTLLLAVAARLDG